MCQEHQTNVLSETNHSRTIAVSSSTGISIRTTKIILSMLWFIHQANSQNSHHTVMSTQWYFRSDFRKNESQTEHFPQCTFTPLLWSCKLPLSPDTSLYWFWKHEWAEVKRKIYRNRGVWHPRSKPLIVPPCTQMFCFRVIIYQGGYMRLWPLHLLQRIQPNWM